MKNSCAYVTGKEIESELRYRQEATNLAAYIWTVVVMLKQLLKLYFHQFKGKTSYLSHHIKRLWLPRNR